MFVAQQSATLVPTLRDRPARLIRIDREMDNDFIARHILHSAGQLTHGSTAFAAVYLLSHGIAKLVLVVAVLRGELWAYPALIALLGAFIAYQLYRLYYHLTIGLTLLTIFDAFVVWLTWREYQQKRNRTPAM